AGPSAAARMHRVAFDLPDVERLLVDVGEDAAGGLAVEADARDDPVAAAVLLRPARGLVIDVIVPLRRIGVRAEVSHGVIAAKYDTTLVFANSKQATLAPVGYVPDGSRSSPSERPGSWDLILKNQH